MKNTLISNNIKRNLFKPKLSEQFTKYTLIPKNSNYNRPVIIFTSILFSFFILFNQTRADNLTSPSFNVDMGTINITGGSKTSSSYRLNDTVGQTAQGEFNSSGYIIKAGFQYISNPTPFTFTISDIDLDFGTLTPGSPSLLTNIIGITTGSAYGYTVKVIQDHSLKLTNGTDTIPDTSCDLASPCTITDATTWSDNGRFGFGYNVNSTDADPEFVNSTYFRPFPIQGTDLPSLVMSKNTAAATASGTITYKLNISGAQAAGTYQNGIQYIAIPAF